MVTKATSNLAVRTADMATKATSYLIVGSGIFGASTALHLTKTHPDAQVTLVDKEAFPPSKAASWDWNKVVRADYFQLHYMKLALEAKEWWRSDPLFRPFYHQNGMYSIGERDPSQIMVDNYTKLGNPEKSEILSVEVARKLHGGLFADAAYTESSVVYTNKDSGHAEAKEALEAAIKACIRSGVKYVEADANSLDFDADGACRGTRTAAGETLRADRVILCTGASTAKFLADSTPFREDIQVGGRLVAAACLTGLAKLSPAAAQKHSRCAVGVYNYQQGHGR
jgi:sarcosine oxidase/L-pipecolate oxidase